MVTNAKELVIGHNPLYGSAKPIVKECWNYRFWNLEKGKPYIYINKDGNLSTISIRHVETNVNTREKNQNNQNNNNEVEYPMLKGHPL
jgi:hypothetical protein